MPSNHIQKIFQDSKGYFWFATENGVAKYNGYSFITLKKNMPNSAIHDITEDKEGSLWFATQDTLNKLITPTNSIINFKVRKRTLGKKEKNDTVFKLHSSENKIWIGSNNGLYNIDINTNYISEIIPDVDVRAFHKGKKNILWIGTTEGLIKLDQSSLIWNKHLFSKNKKDDYNFIKDIISINNTLYIATAKGIIKFNITKNLFFEENENILPGKYISSLREDKNKGLWIATRYKGLKYYSLKNKSLSEISISTENSNTLDIKQLLDIYISKNGHLWIGSSIHGLLHTNISSKIYYEKKSPYSNSSILSNVIYSIYKNNSTIIIGSNKGLSTVDNNRQYWNYPIGTVGNVHHDRDNIYLIASLTGVYKLNSSLKSLEEIHINTLAPNKSNNYRFNIFYKNNKTLYIGSSEGLIEYNNRNKYYLYQIPKTYKENFYANEVFVITKYGNYIIVGTRSGFYYLDRKTNSLQPFIKETTSQIHKAHIQSFAAQDNAYLWIASDKGIFRIKNHKIIGHYTIKNGLPDTIVRAIAIVDDTLWASTDKGLSAFKIGENKFEKIHLNNDQFNIEFNGNAVHKGDDGLLYWGSMEGVIYFDPKDFTESAPPLNTKITGFRLFNIPEQPGSKYLPQAIDFTDHITLDHTQNMLTFEFSSLNYSDPNHLYAYRMDGFTEPGKWITTDRSNRLATFTPQTPGDYIFKVKSGWSENDWSPNVKELKVTILPPWWLTTWAYISYIVLFLVTIITIYQIRTRNMRLRAIELENQVTARTEEVNEQKAVIQRLLNKKNEMFAYISHELRTPLTLIRGPIINVRKAINDHKHKNTLLMAERNSERLSALVEQLLELSRVYQFQEEQKITQCLSEIAEQLAASFQTIAISKNITFTTSITSGLWIIAVERAIEGVLINLLSNALKYTPENGEVHMQISMINEQADIVVTDSGMGMPKDKLHTIFNRFTRLEGASKGKIEGVGLGLALVKQLVEVHNWDIQVSSKLSVGSKFLLTIPLADNSSIETKDFSISKETSKQIDYLEHLLSNKDTKISNTSEQGEASDKNDPTLELKSMDTDKARLLIIDDTEDMLTYLKELLIGEFDCYFAGSGEKGLEIAYQELPDLIICDVMMPGISGFEVLEQLRAKVETSHIPLLLLTAKGDKESRIEGINKLADDYITKPFDGDELKARLQSILALRKLHQTRILQQVLGSDEDVFDDNQLQNLRRQDQDFLHKWEEVVADHYTNHCATIEDLSEAMAVSSRQLLNKIKALCGKSPKEFLDEYRIVQAKKLLKDKSYRISQIAELLGFDNPGYFSKRFRDISGQTPSQFRKSIM